MLLAKASACTPQAHEEVKGCFWILERDCRNGTALKMDKTGKAILTILRHLGRLTEVRVFKYTVASL